MTGTDRGTPPGAPMDNARKKELARAWVERDRQQGVFAVRCRAGGEVWVSSTRNLDTRRNAVWFALRQGGHPNKTVQAAWDAHGEGEFAYEILEQMSEEGFTPSGFNDRLKERERHWQAKLAADRLVG